MNKAGWKNRRGMKKGETEGRVRKYEGKRENLETTPRPIQESSTRVQTLPNLDRGYS